MTYTSLPPSAKSPRVFDHEALISAANSSTHVETNFEVPEIMEAFKDLRYEQPLRLYISSIDALLMRSPSGQSYSSTASSHLATDSCLCPIVENLGTECMMHAANSAGSNKGFIDSNVGANNELNFDKIFAVPVHDGENSGNSVCGGGSKEEIQLHEESTSTASLTCTLPVATVTPHSVASEPIPEEQSSSSNDNSQADSKAQPTNCLTPLPTSNSNLHHVLHETKSSGNDGDEKALGEHTHGGSANNMSVSNQTRLQSTASPIKVFSANTNGIGANGRRSSESDLSTPPTGNDWNELLEKNSHCERNVLGILNTSIQAILSGTHGKGPSFAPSRRPAPSSDHFDMLEYPFITICDLPPKFIQRIGE